MRKALVPENKGRLREPRIPDQSCRRAFEALSRRTVRLILCRCFDVEKNIKPGLLDERLAMELLIANL